RVEVGKNFSGRVGFLGAACNQTIAIFAGEAGDVRHHGRDVKRNWIARPCIEFCPASLVVRASVYYFLPGPQGSNQIYGFRHLGLAVFVSRPLAGSRIFVQSLSGSHTEKTSAV